MAELWTLLRNLLERALRRIVVKADTHEQVIELEPALLPQQAPAGRVLLSYIIDPFLAGHASISNAHTHHFESWQIARAFLDRGYLVDVISYRNTLFRPSKPYDVLIGARTNFHRLSLAVPAGCKRIVHLDTAHWLFNNTAAYRRLLALQQRRKATLYNAKMVEVNLAIEHADMGTVLGNDFTIDTYRYAGKPLYRIPISAPEIYDYPEHRKVAEASRHFIWFGSSGFVHKGLDIVLEAFAQMPDVHLHVCGPFADEADFLRVYDRELFHLPNIHAVGWVDVSSATFTDLCTKSIGVVYPSASEGGGGSVISCMHAGLIPLTSRESSVDIGDFGIDLGDSSVAAVCDAVRQITSMTPAELDRRTRGAWMHARRHHTRETFTKAFEQFLDEVLLP